MFFLYIRNYASEISEHSVRIRRAKLILVALIIVRDIKYNTNCFVLKSTNNILNESTVQSNILNESTK